MAKPFKQGVLVWAKMKGFPPWPARISFPRRGKTPKSRKPQHFVHFFGTHDFAWILDQYIFPHSEEMLANAKKYQKRYCSMPTAIQEIERACQRRRKKFKVLTEGQIKEEPLSHIPVQPANISEGLPKKSKKAVPNKKIKVELEEVETETKEFERKTRQLKKKQPEVKVETPRVERISRKLGKKTPIKMEESKVRNKNCKVEKKPCKVQWKKKTLKIAKKNLKKRSASAMLNDSGRNAKIKVEDEDHSLLIANASSNNGCPDVAVIPPYNDNSKPSCSYQLALNESNLTKNAPIQKKVGTFLPTSKKIGFLGLGVMGCELVKRLLSTGHNVTIWNRNIFKIGDVYATFVSMGAKTAQTPAEVIQDCDITFCCVSDADASKSVVFGRNGVLDGFDGVCSNKAYVEMTTIDPVTSQKIGESIAGKGGRYLEAPMDGTRQDVSTSSMIILTAGDLETFQNCNTVFALWAKNAVFLSCEVGTASKMSLALKMLIGTTYVALAESMTLIKKLHINPGLFLEMVFRSHANLPLLITKGLSIIANDATVYTPIKHLQKYLDMAVKLGEAIQPLPLAAAANEIYVRALSQNKDRDVSAICETLR